MRLHLTLQHISCKINNKMEKKVMLHNMEIHDYQTKSGKGVVMEYIKSLPDAERVDGLSVLENMRNGHMERITFKRWEKKVYEVYFYKHNRIFYIVADGENIYLLHACKKQKGKTEKRDKNLVIKRTKELEKLIGKTFI